MQITTYIHFDGKCEEAINFYKKTLGAQVNAIMRFSDAPKPPDGQQSTGPMPASPEQIMHSEVRFGDTVVFMSDCGKPLQGFSLIYSLKEPAEAQKVFKALSEGGKVLQPMSKTFFSPAFGMVDDRFGVNWMVMVPQQMPQQEHDKDLAAAR